MTQRTSKVAQFATLLLALVLFLMSGCGKQEEVKAETAKAPVPKPFDPLTLKLDKPGLIEGRDIWIPTCGQCHLKGIGGAPKIGDKAAWAKRIAQGNEVLYKHAIEGFSGPQMLIMPPKGGFSDLTDEQVKLAVDFVVYASQ